MNESTPLQLVKSLQDKGRDIASEFFTYEGAARETVTDTPSLLCISESADGRFILDFDFCKRIAKVLSDGTTTGDFDEIREGMES